MPRTHDLLVSVQEMQQGRAVRRCPCCGRDVVVTLPSIGDALRQEDSAALREGLGCLSPREREVFDVLYAQRDGWTTASVLHDLVFGRTYARGSLHTALHLMERKLARTDWRIARGNPPRHTHQTYRLERVSAAEAAA